MRRLFPALAALVVALAAGVAPPAAASDTFPCPSSVAPGGPSRAGYAGAIALGRTEDTSLMYAPVVPAQETLVYIRVVGQVLDPGAVSFRYAFYNISAFDTAEPNVVRCDVAPLATQVHDFGNVPGPVTITIERPVFFNKQNLIMDFHLEATGFAALAWEVELYPCGHGGRFC